MMSGSRWSMSVVALILWMIGAMPAWAVAQLSWGSGVAAPVGTGASGALSIDLRDHWESVLTQGAGQGVEALYKPDDVWRWGAERFSKPHAPSSAIQLRSGQRYVSRINIVPQTEGTSLYLSFNQPRLDAVHVSWRYDGGNWHQHSAGDKIPMHMWTLADRQPTFEIPLRQGQIQLVVEIAHRGAIMEGSFLQDRQSFNQLRDTNTLLVGVVAGVGLMLALIGGFAAWDFQRLGFFSISMITVLMAVSVLSNSGLLGTLFSTTSVRFNDEAKFITTTVWCTALPLVIATALAQLYRSRTIWALAWGFLLIGVAFSVLASPYEYRDIAPTAVPFVVAVSCILSYGFLALTHLRSVVAVSWQVVTVTSLFVASVAAPLLGYMGLVPGFVSQLFVGVCTFVACLLLMHVLLLQHRLGRMVLARADQLQVRDVLTGLPNRLGFERRLSQVLSRCETDRTCAIYMQFSVGQARLLRDQLGDEGFEAGMVQIAASLSASLGAVDCLARTGSNQFSAAMPMPVQPELVNRMAQKVLTRITAIAQHGSALTRTVRISLAWLPACGRDLAQLEQRSRHALRHMEVGKRIAWVGGPDSHQWALGAALEPQSGADFDVAQMARANAPVASLPGVIDRLEAEMLEGIDTRTLEADADAVHDKKRFEINARKQGYQLSDFGASGFESTCLQAPIQVTHATGYSHTVAAQTGVQSTVASPR